MDKLKMEARPMDNILKKVAELCPAAVQGDKIDFERLKEELAPDLIEGNESYNFTWVGKKNAIIGASTPIRKTLRPCKEESKNWDTTKNLYIEGDNLDVLKLLQESYLGKIKMIYADSPYNTGNDFVYCDDFADNCKEYLEKKGQCDVETNERLFKNDESNGRYHSNWCSMIYPRLKIARDLLSDDGVIFMSIDDHEQANLKKICDEIFGESNFITSFVWHNNVKGRQFDKYIKSTYENILMYAKNINAVKINKETYFVDTTNVLKDEISSYKRGYPLHNGTADFHINNRPNLAYSIYYNPETGDAYTKDEKIKQKDGFVIGPETEHKPGYVRIIPKYNTKYNNQRVWRWGAEKFANEYRTELIFENEYTGWYIYGKDRIEGDQASKAYKNYINIDSGNGKIELVDLDLVRIFDNPKTVKLVDVLLKMVSNNTSIILDFFSGSATTAHAVMQLNAEDGGNRKFIMVQLPELCDEKSEAFKAGYKNICEIGKERIRRAGDKIVQETGKSDLDIGFKVLKLDDTNMKEVYYNPTQTKQAGLLDNIDNIKSDRTPLDLLYGVMLDLGLTLDLDIKEVKSGNITYFNVDNGSLLACFEQNIPDSIIKEIANVNPLRVVFRDACFADAPSKINITEIFKTISPNTKITVL